MIKYINVNYFKNNLNSPEMARLTEIAKRRQAFTGSLGATPGVPGDAPAPNPDETFINDVWTIRQSCVVQWV